MIGEALITIALIAFLIVVGVYMILESMHLENGFVAFFSVLYWLLLFGLFFWWLGI